MVEMFDHAYQNYMVSEAFADFLHIFLFSKTFAVCLYLLKKILLLNL